MHGIQIMVYLVENMFQIYFPLAAHYNNGIYPSTLDQLQLKIDSICDWYRTRERNVHTIPYTYKYIYSFQE